MVDVVDIKNALKKNFTLRSEKENAWKTYLNEGSKYVNGGVYIYDTPITYYEQKYSNVDFVGYSSDFVDLNIYYTGEDLNDYQLRATTITYSNGSNLPITDKSLFNVDKLKGVSLRIPYSSNGKIYALVPSINFKDSAYKGFNFTITLSKQTLTVSNYVKNNISVSFDVALTNIVTGQILEVRTLSIDGGVNNAYTYPADNEVSVEFDVSDEDKTILVLLLPYKVDTKYYTGGYYEKTIIG